MTQPPSQTPIQWHWKTFDQLSGLEVYQLLQLRQLVFIVEQDCVYNDTDDLDQNAWHLLGYQQSSSGTPQLAGYLRLLAPDVRYAEPAIGRVLTLESSRGSGVGRELMEQGIKLTQTQFPGQGIRISAQDYLRKFYQSLGFVTVGDVYGEDGIAHIQMLLSGE